MSKTMTSDSQAIDYRHPTTGEPLTVGFDGHLYDAQGQLAFENDRGAFDFVVDEPSRKERAHYDLEYADGGWTTKESLDVVDFDPLWDLDVASRQYLESIGDVRGKKILLIGNGTSIKELLFVKRGAQVTFTDLSFHAVKYVKARYEASALGREFPAGCRFHAVNGYLLPYAEGTFDIVCADAVIHHLEDLEKLFVGIHHCLRPGGICRFRDTGYSPFWQRAKKGVLHRLQQRSHQKHGISPEDRKATERGGYTRAEMESLKAKLGFKELLYRRVALLDYLLWRARCTLNARWLLAFRPMVRGLDRLLARTPVMEKQGIALVLGFEK